MINFKVGMRIKFAEEKKSYKIVALNDRFLICVKPLPLHKTYIYTIVDLEKKLRGPDNMIFGPKFKYNDPVECQEALRQLSCPIEEPVLEVSRRHGVDLKIDWAK